MYSFYLLIHSTNIYWASSVSGIVQVLRPQREKDPWLGWAQCLMGDGDKKRLKMVNCNRAEGVISFVFGTSEKALQWEWLYYAWEDKYKCVCVCVCVCVSLS